MNNEKICPVCGTKNSFVTAEREESVAIRDVEFFVPVKVIQCERCQTEFMDETGDTGLLEARKLYRKRFNMVTPERLIEWRERGLGITQGQLAAILKWGTATVSRYENGKLAEASHDSALRIAMDRPDSLLALVKSAQGLDEDVRRRLEAQLSHEIASKTLENAFFQDVCTAPGQTVSMSKVVNLAAAFCEKFGEFETKLNKLFFYTDFAAYRSIGRSITGLAYERLQHGPVPSNYRILYSVLQKKSVLELEEVVFPNYSGTKLKAVDSWDKNTFTDAELSIVLAVKERFKSLNATQISDLSHKEDAWLKTPMGQIVDYEFAKSLKGI